MLPETDPFRRQVLIGFGTFIELAVIAAAQRGVSAKVELFPDGAPADRELPKGSRVATLVLGEPGSASADPLFAQIVRRHTRKTAYANDRPPPEAVVRSWSETATRFGLRSGVTSGTAAMDPIRRITRVLPLTQIRFYSLVRWRICRRAWIWGTKRPGPNSIRACMQALVG